MQVSGDYLREGAHDNHTSHTASVTTARVENGWLAVSFVTYLEPEK